LKKIEEREKIFKMREILFLSGLGMALKTPCESCKNLEKGITKEMGKGYETTFNNSFVNISLL